MRLQQWKLGGAALLLLATGYILGASGVLQPDAKAQQVKAEDLGLSETTVKASKSAYQGVNVAMKTLEDERTYVPAIKGVNSFAVTVGGLNAIEDLETGRGVDPETFAGLYSGQAVDHVKQHLSRDGEGRLLYKNKLVRMYPISTLQNLFQRREQISLTE